MSKILKALRRFIADLGGGASSDPLAAMTIRELADLPAYHPQSEH